MKRYYLLEILFCYLFLTVLNCCTPPSPLEEALALSGENRGELEKVLNHYKHDSLKLKAAEFLIANMPGHCTLRGETIDHYRSIIDNDTASSYFYKKVLDISLSHFKDPGKDARFEEDIYHIKSDFLIRHIDLSFDLLYKYSWLDVITFDHFLEYLLPYRFGNERLDLWRDSLHVYDTGMPSGKVGDYFTNSFSSLISKLKLKESTQKNIQIRRSLLVDNSLGDCYLNSHYNMLELRSLGIPAMIDFIPYFANRNGYHYWSNEPSILFNKNYLELVFDRKPGKIYRKTFSRNQVPAPKEDEYIPSFFTDPFIKDVTDLYYQTVNIQVDANREIPKPATYAYLSVFNNLSWKPIAIGEVKGNKAYFGKITKNTVYLPVYYENENVEKVYNYPFILNFKGENEYLIPDTGKLQNICLYRKNPKNSNTISYYYNRLKKCVVEASTNKKFNQVDTVFRFDQTSHEEIISVSNLKDNAYRWYRINAPEQNFISEIYCYDEQGHLIQAEVKQQNNLMIDGDPLTYSSIDKSSPLIFNFDHPVKLSKIICLTRSDGNGIYPNNTYELFYFDLDGWKSLGIKPGDNFFLEYDHVPSNALYWLRNWTTGKEERIFMFQDGIQKFW